MLDDFNVDLLELQNLAETFLENFLETDYIGRIFLS
jgi:hypothetical protein